MHRTTRLALVISALALLIALTPGSVAQNTFKVGVFDSQRISIETAEGKRVQAQLNSLRDAKQQQIDGEEQTINDLQQRLSQQGLSLSAETRASLELDIQRRLLELNTSKDLAGRQLQLEVAAAEAGFNEKLRVVVQQFGRDEGFSLLLEVGAVAWASNSADVTTALIDLFDQLYPPKAQ